MGINKTLVKQQHRDGRHLHLHVVVLIGVNWYHFVDTIPSGIPDCVIISSRGGATVMDFDESVLPQNKVIIIPSYHY